MTINKEEHTEYPALRPSEVRAKLDGLTDLKTSMDTLRDELYEIGLTFTRKKLELEYAQLQVTKAVYGFLTTADMAKENELKERLNGKDAGL